MQPGSLQEQKERKRARFKIAVYSVFGLTFLLMCFFLIQGCKKESPTADTSAPTNMPDTNLAPDTNVSLPPPAPTNYVPPVVNTPPPPPPAPAPVVPETREYVVAKGDSFYSIGKKFGVKIKEIEAANPNVVPAKLKVGQKLQIPAPGGGASATPAAGADASGDTYKVKSGDTLGKIAKANGVTVKALTEANELKNTRIKVGQVLKLPSRAAAPEQPAAVPAPVPAPVSPAPAPVNPGTPTSPTGR